MDRSVEVRPRLASDSRDVRRVARKTWRATYGAIVPTGMIVAILRRGYARERLVLGLTDAKRDAFVAARRGVVVGYADAYEDPPGVVELRRIYVLPAAQGAGAGAALLREVIAAARKRGAARLDVAVDSANAAALSWYERRGFVRCGTSTFDVDRWSRPQIRLSLPLEGRRG